MLPSPEDHVAISALFARYCLTLDVHDVDGWVDLYLADARYEVYGRSWDGHEGLRKMSAGAPHGLHLGGPPVVEMDGTDRARVTRNLLFLEQQTGVSRSAVYEDELRRTGDGWRIACTRCQLITADGLRDRPDR